MKRQCHLLQHTYHLMMWKHTNFAAKTTRSPILRLHVTKLTQNPNIMRKTTHLIMAIMAMTCIASNAQTLPEAVTTLSQLNIVGTKTVEVSQYVRSSYQADNVTIDATDLPTLLGVDESVIATNIGNMVYGKYMDPTDEILTDYTTATYTATPHPGFWYNTTVDEESGEENTELIPGSIGAYSKFYVAGIGYDTDTHSLKMSVGQYPDRMSDGERKEAIFYIVCGDKAYAYTVALTTNAVPISDFSDMTQVGDTTVQYTAAPNTDYSYGTIELDITAIAGLLGCSEADVMLKAMSDATTLSTHSTANNGGYWLTKEDGYICSWGAGAGFFIEPANSSTITTLHCGQYPNAYSQADTEPFNYCLYYTYADKYYKLVIEFKVYKINDDIIETGDEDKVSEEYFEVQLNPGNSEGTKEYKWASGVSSWGFASTQLGLDHIKQLLGTDTPTFYARSKTMEEDGGSKIELTSMYSLTYTNTYYNKTYYGFWTDASGSYAVSQKQTDSAYGVRWDPETGAVSWHQVSGQRNAGDFFNGIFYLMNDETGKYIEYHFEIEFQNEFPAAPTVVGEEDIYVIADFDYSHNDADATPNDLDLTNALEAFGTDADTFAELAVFAAGRTSNSFTTSNYDEMMGYAFSGNGQCINQLSDEVEFYISYEPIDQQLCAFAIDAIPDGTTYSLRLAFDYDSKRYIYNVTLCNSHDYEALTSGIKPNIGTQEGERSIFDLSGRKLDVQPQRGLYIMGGKKIIVK